MQINKRTLAQMASAMTSKEKEYKKNSLHCPQCDKMMWDSEPNITHSNPNRKRVHCDCGYSGWHFFIDKSKETNEANK